MDGSSMWMLGSSRMLVGLEGREEDYNEDVRVLGKRGGNEDAKEHIMCTGARSWKG